MIFEIFFMTNKTAVAGILVGKGRQSWTDFGIAHITDMHVVHLVDLAKQATATVLAMEMSKVAAFLRNEVAVDRASDSHASGPLHSRGLRLTSGPLHSGG